MHIKEYVLFVDIVIIGIVIYKVTGLSFIRKDINMEGHWTKFYS